MGVKRDVGVATGLTVGALALLTFVFTPPQQLPADDGTPDNTFASTEFTEAASMDRPSVVETIPIDEFSSQPDFAFDTDPDPWVIDTQDLQRDLPVVMPLDDLVVQSDSLAQQ